MRSAVLLNILKNGVLIVVSLAVSFLVAETALHMAGYRGEVSWNLENMITVDDSVLNFRFRPNSESFTGNITYRLNSAGFRDSEHRYEKAPNMFRILVMGDSVAFGYKVKVEDTFSLRLEKLLEKNQGNVKAEVVTLAMPGLNSFQEAHLLQEEGRKYSPDLIVMLYSLNDADSGVSFKKKEEDVCRIELIHMEIPCAYKTFMKSSALLFFLKDRLDGLMWKLHIGDQDDVFGSIQTDYFSKLYTGDIKWKNNVLSGFDIVRDYSAQTGVPVLLVVSPVMYDFGQYSWKWIHEKIAKDAVARGFVVVDLLPLYSRYSVMDVRVERGDFVHPGKLGHEIAAAATSEAILKNSLLQRHSVSLN